MFKPPFVMKNVLANCVMGCVCLAGAVKAATVYDNTTTDLGFRLDAGTPGGTMEIGDEIVLGGTERSLTAFTFQYYLQSSNPETLRLRFYAQDGPSGQPGTSFFDSGPFAIPATGSGSSEVEITDFVTGAAFPLTALLPDRFTWAVTFSGVDSGSGESAGVNLFGPPTIGDNIVDYWENSGGGWVNKRVGTLPTDFAARMQAVPEPSTVALFLVGSVALVWRLRKRAARSKMA